MVAVPLGAAFVLPIVAKVLKSDRLADLIAVAVSLFLFVASLRLLFGPAAVYWVGKWSPASIIGIDVVLDGLSKLMLVTVNLVSLAAVIFSVSYMERYTSKGLYYSLFLLMVGGMNGVVLSGDLFNLYVFLEVAGIASYALVGFGCESEELEASFKYLILGVVATTMILFGVGILYNVTGTVNMAQIAASINENGMNNAILLACSFFLMGFGLKAAMVPFHAWLPDAHPSAPAPISAMLSGVLIKALGVYGICRVFFNVIGVGASPLLAHVLIALGTVSMVIGVFLAVGQWDFKRLLAYHSISQMGYVILALGVGAELLARNPDSAVGKLAVFGGLFHMFNHAAFKSLLFLCSGAVEYGTGTRQLKELGGLSGPMPVTSGCCRVAALSISGVPPFNGFWSKLIIIIAVVQAGHYVLGGMTVLVSFMTLVSFIKVQRYILQGDLPSALAGKTKEVPLLMCAAMILLAVVCFGAGIFCYLARGELLDPARDVLAGGLRYVHLVLGG